MSTALVDDQLLGALLRDEHPDGLPRGVPLATTGLWYSCLCSAYFTGASRGVLSRPFEHLGEPHRSRAEERLLELPGSIGLPGLCQLAPRMGTLRCRHHRLNALGLEVLAAATMLDADVFARAPSPELATALRLEGRSYTVLTK